MSAKTTAVCIGFLACVAVALSLNAKVDRMEKRVAAIEQNIEQTVEYASGACHVANITRARLLELEAAAKADRPND